MNNMNGINSYNNYNPMWSTPYSSPSPYGNNYLNRNYTSQTQSAQQQQVSQNNIIWVKGKENARSMQVPPNSTIILLDSEVGKFYIKTTDDIGLGKIRVFSYTEEPDIENGTDSTKPDLDLSNYVTKEQLQKAIKEMKENNEQLISTIKQKTAAKQQSKVADKQF